MKTHNSPSSNKDLESAAILDEGWSRLERRIWSVSNFTTFRRCILLATSK